MRDKNAYAQHHLFKASTIIQHPLCTDNDIGLTFVPIVILVIILACPHLHQMYSLHQVAHCQQPAVCKKW